MKNYAVEFLYQFENGDTKLDRCKLSSQSWLSFLPFLSSFILRRRIRKKVDQILDRPYCKYVTVFIDNHFDHTYFNMAEEKGDHEIFDLFKKEKS